MEMVNAVKVSKYLFSGKSIDWGPKRVFNHNVEG